MNLSDLMHTGLPFNRKERFFTGTVFPMIVCRDNFKHFGSFASLVKDCPHRDVSAHPDSCEIQFFTEYSLVESIHDPATSQRFPDLPTRKDTPDIMILIHKYPRTLIALEAKMYENSSVQDLKDQMDKQRANILDYLRGKLNIEVVCHCALLPRKLSDRIGDFGYPVITWDDIHAEYARICPEDYFLRILKTALDRYGALVASEITFGKNRVGDKLTGREIYDLYKKGNLHPVIMGRNLGLHGRHLSEDIRSGKWAQQQYETSSQPRLPNSNWFTVEAFVKEIDDHVRAHNEPTVSLMGMQVPPPQATTADQGGFDNGQS